MKLLKTTATLLFLFVAASWSGEAIAQDGIKFFHGTLAEAQAEAAKEGKLVFVDAYTVWCGPCKWMAANTFPNNKVGEFFNKHFVSLKLDMEKGEGPSIGRKYRVMAYPTLLFMDGSGKVVHRAMGAKGPDQFLELAKKIQAKS